MAQGKFITFYGINNIGKSTHAKRLVRRLQVNGFEAKYLKYPVYDASPTGGILNSILRSGRPQSISEEELQLWFVLNRYQFQPQLLNYLKKGVCVVAEDYCGTGIGWGMAKGLDQYWLETINRTLFPSDFSIFLTGKRAYPAKEKNHIHEENDALMNKTHEIFKQLAEHYGWHTVELCEKKKDTEEKIWKLVELELFGT